MRPFLVVMMVAGSAQADAPFPDLPKQVALVKQVSATSTFSDKSDPTDYSAWRALAYETRGGGMDGSPAVLWSAWCEGKKDEGLGETLTITFAEPTKIDSVKIAAGVWRTDAFFKANNQITALDVIADGKSQTVKPPAKDWVEAKIGDKVTTLAFKINAVKKGKMNDTCISGIDLIRDGNTLPVAIGVDAAAWAALPGAIGGIQKAIDARKGLDTLIEFPFKSRDLAGDFAGYGGSVDATIASYKDLLAACKTYDAKRAKAGDWVDPKGCPTTANYDPSDERGDFVFTDSPGTLLVMFPSHKELAMTWKLHWTDRWRLGAIGER